MDADVGSARGDTASDDRSQARSPAPAPSSLVEQKDQGGKRSLKLTSQLEQSKSNTSSDIKRDARAAELPDEDEQGGKFQHVPEESLCELSVEDDFVIDENAEGVDEEIIKAIVVGKKKEIDAMEAFGIFGMCEEFPKDAKVITTRWENVRKCDKWRCRFVAREFRHDDPEMEGLHASSSTAATGRLVDMHAVRHGYSILCLRTSMLKKTRKSTVGLPKNGSRGITPEVVELNIFATSIRVLNSTLRVEFCESWAFQHYTVPPSAGVQAAHSGHQQSRYGNVPCVDAVSGTMVQQSGTDCQHAKNNSHSRNHGTKMNEHKTLNSTALNRTISKNKCSARGAVTLGVAQHRRHGRVSSSWKNRLAKAVPDLVMRVDTTSAARRPWVHFRTATCP